MAEGVTERDPRAGAGVPSTPQELAAAANQVQTLDELGELLRGLRRRHARRQHVPQLTVRELAHRSGYARGAVSEYLSGKTLPPTDRFDVLTQLLGAGPAEQRALATARDRVEEQRRARRTVMAVPRELPPGVPEFIGRSRELAELDRLCRRDGKDGGKTAARRRFRSSPAPPESGSRHPDCDPGVIFRLRPGDT